MSYESNIPGTDHFFAGEDKTLSYEVFAAGSTTLMENVNGFTLRWELRRWGAAGASVLVKTTSVTPPDPGGIAITGAYDSARALNSQRVIVTIADTDTDGLLAGRYVCALKRLDAGLEAVLSHGTVEVLVSAVRV